MMLLKDEEALPEEALAAFAGQGIEVVTICQISTDTTHSGLLIICQLLLLIPFILPCEHFTDDLHSSGFLVHSHPRDNQISLASLPSHLFWARLIQ